MLRRGLRKTFADYFSPAESAFTDFITRNPRSLLTPAAGRAFDRTHGSRDVADDDRTAPTGWNGQGYLVEPGRRIIETVPLGEGAGVERAHDILRGLSKDSGSGPLLLGGDEDGEGGRRDDRRSSDKRRQDTSRRNTQTEPPREVHPPDRSSQHEAECKDLLSLIFSLRVLRETRMNELEGVKSKLNTLAETWAKNYDSLQEKKERLSAWEYQLKLVTQPYPPSVPPREFRPREPGPVPDIVTEAWVNKMRRDIEKLRHEIDFLEAKMHDQEQQIQKLTHEMLTLRGDLSDLEAQLDEPERQYRLKCGPLEPLRGKWR